MEGDGPREWSSAGRGGVRGCVDSGRGGDPGPRGGGVRCPVCRMKGPERQGGGQQGQGVTALCPLSQQDSMTCASRGQGQGRGRCAVPQGAEAVGRCGLESQPCLDGPGGPGVVPTSLARLPALLPPGRPPGPPGPPRSSPLPAAGLRSTLHQVPRIPTGAWEMDGESPAEAPTRRRQRADVLGKGSQFPLSSCPSRWPGQGRIARGWVTSDLSQPAHCHATEGTTPTCLAPGRSRSARRGRVRAGGQVCSCKRNLLFRVLDRRLADAGRAGRASSQQAPTVRSQHFSGAWAQPIPSRTLRVLHGAAG